LVSLAEEAEGGDEKGDLGVDAQAGRVGGAGAGGGVGGEDQFAGQVGA
jgi:hypothetical protein